MLRLQVRDNGRGLIGSPRRGGVGLSNTRARLARLYGAAHRFELSEDPHGGAVVTVEVPFRSRGGRAETFAQASLGGGGYVPALSD